MSVFARVSLVLIVGALAGGCAPRQQVPHPVLQGGAAALAESYARGVTHVEGLRASGVGDIATGSGSLPFAFAFAWSRAGWIRADVRPDPASAWTSLLFARGDTVRAYVPSRGIEARERLGDALAPWAPAQIMAAVVGVPDLTFLASLGDASVLREGSAVTVVGSHRGSPTEVDLRVDGRGTMYVTRLCLGVRGGRLISFRYDGQGWGRDPILPKTVSVLISGEGSVPAEIRFEYRSLKPAQALSAAQYAYATPPGVRRVNARDLLGRQE